MEIDFKKHGYSVRSLEMLDSEEGQLNAVFACYGSAAQHGQLLEAALSKLVILLSEYSGLEPPDSLKKKTLGQLLRFFDEKFVVEIDDWVPRILDAAREQRNFLIHEYFLKRSDKMRVESGRFEILRELVGIESQLRKGRDLFNGLRVAVEEVMKGKRQENSEARTVFSVTLRIEQE